jgi:ERCC4-type nuclease
VSSISTPSTIYVDDREIERPHPTREGDTSGINMLNLVRDHRTHPTALPKHLPAGDFCFAGEGPKGPALIGIERKRVKDMMASIRNGRFSGEQVPKLLDHYDFSYLVIEGRFRTNWHSGVLEEKWGRDYSPVVVGKSTFVGLELESFLISIALRTPIRVVPTRDEKETVEFIISANHNFSKPWSDHSAHSAIHQPEQYATVGKASTVRRIAYTLSGVGWERSGVVEQHFSSVESMVSASPGDWAKLPGFGKVLSQRVWDQLHGNYDPGILE